MEFKWYRFDEMEASRALAMLSLRHKVFSQEQLSVGQEVDDWDRTALHLCVMDGREVIGCLRLCQLISDTYDTYEIGRLCVAPQYRHQRIGKKMLSMAILKGMGNGLEAQFETRAPVYLMGFYRSLGFEPAGDPWIEDDIPQIFMKLSQQPRLLEMQSSNVKRRPLGRLSKR